VWCAKKKGTKRRFLASYPWSSFAGQRRVFFLDFLHLRLNGTGEFERLHSNCNYIISVYSKQARASSPCHGEVARALVCLIFHVARLSIDAESSLNTQLSTQVTTRAVHRISLQPGPVSQRCSPHGRDDGSKFTGETDVATP